jgi:hypothetical protein
MTKSLKAYWNLDFTKQRRQNIRHTMRQNLRSSLKGKGNKAWKRADREERAWRASGGFYVTDYI